MVKEFHHVNQLIFLGYKLQAWVGPPCPRPRKDRVKLEGDVERWGV